MAQQKNWYDDQNQQANSGSSVLAGNSNAATGNGQTTGTATGSGYDNLSKYLDANKGQASGMANALTSNLNDQTTKNHAAANDWATQQKSTVDKGIYQNDSNNLLSDINRDGAADAQQQRDTQSKADAMGAFTPGYYNQLQQGGQAHLSQMDKNQANYSNRLNQAAYTGPSEAGNYQGVLDAYQNTSKAAADLAGDRNNQKTALQANQSLLGATGPYTGGMANLDSFILAGDGAASKQLQDNAADIQSQNSVDSFNQKKGDVNNYIGTAQAKGAANKDAFRQSLNSQYDTSNAGGYTPEKAYQNEALGKLLNRYGR